MTRDFDIDPLSLEEVDDMDYPGHPKPTYYKGVPYGPVHRHNWVAIEWKTTQDYGDEKQNYPYIREHKVTKLYCTGCKKTEVIQ